MLRKKCILFFLFFITTLSGNAITINNNFTNLYIGTNILFFEDTSGKLNLMDIEKYSHWKKSSKNFFNFGFKQTVVWMKFTITNKTKQPIYFTTGYPKYDLITLYQPTGDGLYTSYETGLKYSFAHRQVKDPLVTFFITNAVNGTYYIRTIAKNFPFQIFPQLQSERKYFNQTLYNNWVFIFYLFAMGILLFLSLFYFILTREKEFLFQIFYILSWILFQLSFSGYGFQYIWHFSGAIDKYIFIVSMHIIGVLTAFLYRYYLNLKYDLPVINKYITNFILYPIIIGLMFIFVLPYRVMLQMSLLIALYTIISEFILGIILIKKKKILALLLFIGFLGVQIGGGITIIGSIHLYSNWPIMRWGNFIGNFWVILFLFLTLSYKYKFFKSKLKKSEKELYLSYFVIENGMDPAFWIRETGNFIYANKSAVNLSGYDKEEFMNMHPWDIIKEVSNKQWEIMWNKLKKEKILINEFTLLAKDGTEIAIEAHANFLEYDNEQYNFVFMHDIRRKKETLKKLKENERNLAITLNSIGDGVIVTDIEGKVVRMNPVAENLTGWNLAEARDKHLKEIFHIINYNTNKAVENPVEKVIKTGKIVGLANHTVLISKDEKKYHIADSGAPIIDNGKIIGVVIVFRNVTQEYKLQEQLRRAQTLQALGELAGGVAHDFNNLLAAILGNAELIKAECEKEESIKMAQSIINLSEQGSHLTKKLLSLSSKSEKLEKEVNLVEIIMDVINILEHTINKKIKIQNKIDMSQTYYILGDFIHLHSAILNIALNAADAIQDKGTITFEVEKKYLSALFCKNHLIDNTEGEYAIVSISDTGRGISKENINKIFEPFFTTKKMGRGTGLGLSVTYNTIQQHQGGISVYSEEGVGTTFRLYLKLIKPSKVYAEKKVIVKGKGTILVIDDEEILLDVLKKLLEKLGYDVITFQAYNEAIEYYRNNFSSIDVVLMDYIMPEKNGIEMYQEMKQFNNDIKVIIMSGFSQNLKLNDMIKLGIKDFISKPFNISEISKTLKKVIEE